MKDELFEASLLAEDYYDNLHQAHNSMRGAFQIREQEGLLQDRLAASLGIDKSLVSKRLSGRENLTLKTLSHMATALHCKLIIEFLPFEHIPKSNHFNPIISDEDAEHQLLEKKLALLRKEDISMHNRSDADGLDDVPLEVYELKKRSVRFDAE